MSRPYFCGFFFLPFHFIEPQLGRLIPVISLDCSGSRGLCSAWRRISVLLKCTYFPPQVIQNLILYLHCLDVLGGFWFGVFKLVHLGFQYQHTALILLFQNLSNKWDESFKLDDESGLPRLPVLSVANSYSNFPDPACLERCSIVIETLWLTQLWA